MGVAALAAAATAAGAAAATTGTPAAARARRLRVRDLDRDATPVELAAVELGDRVLRLLVGVHLDEAETARLPGDPVGDDRRRQHVAALGEELAKPLTGG